MRSARSSWPHSLGPYAALRRGSDFAPLGRCTRESAEIRRSVKWLWVSWRVGTNALMSVIALRLGAEAPRGAARPIREASTQPAQPEVGGCKQRCTSSQRRDRSPVRHFPQGPQIAYDAHTNDMPNESCGGPCSGVPLRPQPAPFYLLLPSVAGSLAESAVRRARRCTLFTMCGRFTETAAFDVLAERFGMRWWTATRKSCQVGTTSPLRSSCRLSSIRATRDASSIRS